MSEIVKLYPAVSEAEFQQFMSTGRFELVPGLLEGKWFAETAAGSKAMGRLVFPRGSGVAHERIIEIEIEREIAYRSVRYPNLDRCGPVRFAELEQLNFAIVREAQRP